MTVPTTGSSIGSAISALIAAIPVAQDGDIMTRHHHNSLRNAIAALALSLDIRPGDQTITIIPTFLPGGGGARTWNQGVGFVEKAQGADSAVGWMQIALPDGALLKTLTVIGSKSGNVNDMSVQLLRGAINSTSTQPMATVPLDAEPNSFSRTVPITSSIARVDNKAFKYLLRAEIIGADTASSTSGRLTAFQIVCEA